MSLRLPQNLSTVMEPQNRLSALEREIAMERAATFGRLGRQVEQSLAALRACADHRRPALVKAAAEAVWEYFVQRELCGLVNHDRPIADYAIPNEVRARLGAEG